MNELTNTNANLTTLNERQTELIAELRTHLTMKVRKNVCVSDGRVRATHARQTKDIWVFGVLLPCE